MSPSKLNETVVLERIRWARKMIASIKDLPLHSFETFTTKSHITAAADSYLRRGLEALLDLGRHLLAKGFGVAPAEYKAIARELEQQAVLTRQQAQLLEQMAGYRNRMVHFYHNISDRELYEICSQRLGEIEIVLTAIEGWIESHPEKIDRAL